MGGITGPKHTFTSDKLVQNASNYKFITVLYFNIFFSDEFISFLNSFSELKFLKTSNCFKILFIYLWYCFISQKLYNSYYRRQCYPLESLLLALNVTRIDLLSLDVEYFEKEIIEHFDFSRFNIQVFWVIFFFCVKERKLR